MKNLAIFVGIVVCLSACTSRYASNAEQQYLKSRNGKIAVVPQPLTGSNISHFYDLPDARETVVPSILPPQ